MARAVALPSPGGVTTYYRSTATFAGMRRPSAHAGLVAALLTVLLPAGANAAHAAPATPTAAAAPVPAALLPFAVGVDQPLDYGPPGTLPTGRITAPPPLADQQRQAAVPLRPTTTPRFVDRPYGGDYMLGWNAAHTASFNCTNGFNVESNARIQYMMTAGHCVRDAGGLWYWPNPGGTSPVANGFAQYTLGAGGDHGTLKATSDRTNQVRVSSGTVIRTLTNGGNPRLTETGCQSNGHTNHDNCATAVALNQTVTGTTSTGQRFTVGGLTRWENFFGSYCPGPGDSGSPILESTEGVGIVSIVGRSTDGQTCIVWSQDLGKALTAESVHLG